MRGLVVLAMAGCSFTGPPPGAGADDAAGGPDAFVPDPDAAPGSVCYGRNGFRVCVATEPTQPIGYATSTTLDTSQANAGNCDFLVGMPAICVISRTDITINAGVRLRVTGPNPIVFGATGSITVIGTIDVASLTGVDDGAGAHTGTCTSFTAAGANSLGGAGGAGGSLVITAGGGGGGHPPAPGGKVGLGIPLPNTLRGGCPGGVGGDGTQTGNGGAPGSGGGAVGLFSHGSITIPGFVDASGGGGGGGTPASGGGGGGGSGGMIVLDGITSVSVPGKIYANGGGGGGAASTISAGGRGWQTIPGDAVTETMRGDGGIGTPNGAAGGKGSTRANAAEGGIGADIMGGGGGGGGGAVGVIRVLSGQGPTIPATNVSPVPST